MNQLCSWDDRRLFDRPALAGAIGLVALLGSLVINASFPSAVSGCPAGLSSPEATPESATTPTGSLFCIMITVSSILGSFVSFSLTNVPSGR